MILGEKKLTSRETPPLGPEGKSDWVWGDVLPSGQAVVRFCAGEPPCWEREDSGRTHSVESVPVWAEIRSR